MKRRALLLAIATAASAVRAVPTAAEQARIDRLIDAVSGLNGLQFIRNGGAHSRADAAAFLREKLKARGADVTTAEQFIERIASVSSASGLPYRIRFADGREMTSGEFLGALLKALDKP
jgi:hypothetical protein